MNTRMTLEVRNQLQAEDQNFMWLEGSDLSLSLEEWMAPNSRIPIPDCAYPITRS